MKKAIYVLTTMVCLMNSASAQNLVANNSFEDTTYCDGHGNLEEATGWYSPGGSSPDHFNACGNVFGTDGFGMPDNFVGHQYPLHGSSYAGLGTYSITDTTYPLREYREVMTTHLTQTLTIGTRYYVSAYISLSDLVYNYENMHCASNNFGFRFTTYPYFIETPATNFAQINFDTIVIDTANWTKMTGSFIADSAYTHLSIGNFFDNAHTTCLCPNAYPSLVYYFVDYVCVSPDSTLGTYTTNTGINQAQSSNFKFQIYPNPASNNVNVVVGEELIGSTLTLTDVTGREIKEEKLKDQNSKLETQDFANGIYFLAIRKPGIDLTQKLVIQR